MHPSFFKNLGPINVNSIEDCLNCRLHNITKEQLFDKFTGINNTSMNGISFLNNAQLKNYSPSMLGTIMCDQMTRMKLEKERPIIEVFDIHDSIAILSQVFYRQYNKNEINELPKPSIGENCTISKNVEIENGAVIGKNVEIETGSKIGYNCIIGDDCSIDSNSVITNSILGENVHIGRNTSIGQQGFGFAINKSENKLIFHIGRVILQKNVNIGSNCAIDRGSFSDTVIGENSFFDNHCHVAHNVKVGQNCIFAGMNGIAGSSVIGNNVLSGGQSGIAGHIKIGDNVQIAAKSAVFKNVKDNESVMGNPAINKLRYLKRYLKLYE